jgi:hypothetical protein
MASGAAETVYAEPNLVLRAVMDEAAAFYSESTIAKNQNTYAKRQREQEKKQRANDKRAKRDRKKGIESTAAPFHRFFTRPDNPGDDD